MISNKYMMGVMVGGGEENAVVAHRPIPQKMSKREALELAAWIVCLADDSMGEEGGEFHQILEELLDE